MRSCIRRAIRVFTVTVNEKLYTEGHSPVMDGLWITVTLCTLLYLGVVN